MKISLKRIFLIISLAISSAHIIYAQSLLTADDAISVALKNNFDILVARNNASIDSINNTAGNAGMLPGVSVTGSDVLNPKNYIDQNLPANATNNYNTRVNTMNAGVGLNWTVFDGGKMFVTRKKLNEIQSLGEIQFKEQVLQSVYDVILAYYNVVKQKQQLISINEVITYNLERVKISQTSYDAGLSPKTNLLQAKIDLNVYQENAIDQKAVILASKRKLNQLLGREADMQFEVVDSIPLEYFSDKSDLINKLDSSNTSINLLRKETDIARLSVKEMYSQLFPKINFNAGYNLSQSNNTSGSVLMNRTYGPSFGGSISIPIFQGGNTLRQIKTAKIQLHSAEYNLENMKLQVNQMLLDALTQYESQQALLQIEKDNSLLAKENLEIAIQRLRFGQTTSLEVSQAEANFVESLTRLTSFRYNMKVSETRLKQLMSKL